MKKADRPQTKLVLWVFIVVFLLVLLHGVGVLKPFEDLLLRVTQPVTGAFSRLGQKQIGSGDAKSVEALTAENKELRLQVEDLIIDNARLTTRLTELQAASPAADFLAERDLPFLLARTTNVFSYQDASSLLLDKGEADGVAIGQAVVFREGFLVGVVREVFSHSARVQLLFDNDTQLSATFAGNGAPQGIVSGQLGLSLTMELIPRDTEVGERTVVLTAGIEEAIPPGLVIGEVLSVEELGSELFKRAQVAPPWELQELITVAVITL
ncbi:MAG: rod shape-determining protein MreC [Patescibacteria group bacterium]|jgi:rod shape-determining protein MreC